MIIVRNILAVVMGLIVGSLVNMSLIMVSGKVIPPPPGSDLTTLEGLTTAMANMEFKHFIFPFLAHALGTFVGAMVAILVAASKKRNFAWIIAVCFFVGGFLNVLWLPSSMWFNVIDLLLAYFPMAWFAIQLGIKK